MKKETREISTMLYALAQRMESYDEESSALLNDAAYRLDMHTVVINALKTRLERLFTWMLSGDTGRSSMAIVAHLHGIDTPDLGGADHPLDASDFGRCHRLLTAIPEYRLVLETMASRSAAWAALVQHWDELTRLYETGGGCYARMSEILGAVESAA